MNLSIPLVHKVYQIVDARAVTEGDVILDVILDAEVVGNVPAVMDAKSTGVIADRVAKSTVQGEPKCRTLVPTPLRSLRLAGCFRG